MLIRDTLRSPSDGAYFVADDGRTGAKAPAVTASSAHQDAGGAHGCIVGWVPGKYSVQVSPVRPKYTTRLPRRETT